MLRASSGSTFRSWNKGRRGLEGQHGRRHTGQYSLFFLFVKGPDPEIEYLGSNAPMRRTMARHLNEGPLAVDRWLVHVTPGAHALSGVGLLCGATVILALGTSDQLLRAVIRDGGALERVSAMRSWLLPSLAVLSLLLLGGLLTSDPPAGLPATPVFLQAHLEYLCPLLQRRLPPAGEPRSRSSTSMTTPAKLYGWSRGELPRRTSGT